MSDNDPPTHSALASNSSSTSKEAPTGPSVDSAAARLADKQSRLLDAQLKNLAGENRQLAVKWLRERLHVTFELLLAGALVCAVLAGGVAAWQASYASGLVIQPMATPPDLGQRGLTGAVIASRLLDRVQAIRDATTSVRAGAAARPWRAEEVKVAIPYTGISVAEAARLLRGWLGHETPVTGEVFRDNGAISLTVRVGDRPGQTVSGLETQIDPLIQRGAEAVLAQTEPYRYAVYLSTQRRRGEALEVAKRLAGSGTAEDRAWGYAMWGRLLASNGDFNGALAMGRRSVELNSDLPATHDNLAAAQRFLGHDQDAADEDAKAFLLMQRQRRSLDPANGPIRLATADAHVREAQGDYAGATAAYRRAVEVGGAERAAMAAASLPRTLAGLHDIFAAQRQLRELPSAPPEDAVADMALAGAKVELAMEDWPGALKSLKAADAAAAGFGPGGEQFRRTFVWPMMASAMARGGDLAGAAAMIDRMPADCYLCLRVAGRIAGLQGDRARAENRFAQAAAVAPRLPAAYSELGEMRLAHGDPRGAIDALQQGAARGPAWADPLLLWGEALMAQGRVAEAADKLKAAVTLAPNWARAQQRLAEALTRLGRQDEALPHLTQARLLYQPRASPQTGQTVLESKSQ